MSSTQTVLIDMTPLDTQSRYRGFGRYVRALGLGLGGLPAEQKQGVRILGLTRLGWDGSYEVTEDIAGFEGNPDVPKPQKADHYKVCWRKRVALWKAVRSIDPDLVHLGDPGGTPVGRALTRAKWLTTCHDLIGMRIPEHYFSSASGGRVIGPLIERRRYVSPDHLIAISDCTRDDLRRFFDVPADKITRIYRGCDTAAWKRPLEASWRDRVAKRGLAGKPFLLYVGDTDWRKNVEGMVFGLAEAKKLGVDVDLAFAGMLSQARIDRIDALAREAGVTASIKRLGYVDDDDLLALFRAAVAHIFVSRAEGFGITVIESMAAGCPVITTKASSLGEVAGDAALTADPEDHPAIGRAIATFANDEPLRQRYVEAGKARAEMFSLRAEADQTLALYRKLLAH
jgi:glycosyltransferase involved in cell wall biosynthesis